MPDTVVFLAKSAGVWLALVVLAVLNGAARERLLVPRIGERVAQPASALLLCAVIFLVALASVRIMGVSSIERCWMAGALWLSLTVAFEFLFGHYVVGDSWRTLFQAYDVRRGNLWPLVIAVTAVSPYGAAQLRGLV